MWVGTNIKWVQASLLNAMILQSKFYNKDNHKQVQRYFIPVIAKQLKKLSKSAYAHRFLVSILVFQIQWSFSSQKPNCFLSKLLKSLL